MKTLWASTAYVGAALLLAIAYLFNLGSLYAPTNGDEMVYLHIARLTSESGHWLPLVSDLQTPTGSEMRNTKPPLLFWQAMLAGNWSWDLWTLRLPYVLETLFTAGIVGWLANKLMRGRPQLKTGLLAAALYLGFFATYRYGRPVLSSSIESLFLFSVYALVITRLPSWKAYPARLSAASGLLIIPALLSKSFVLAAPVGLWLFVSLWVLNDAKPSVQKFWQSAWPAAVAVAIGVMGFALWFALDPNPAAVWREFVVGENFSTKFSDGRSDSIPAFWLSPMVNAGLLFPLLIGLLIAAVQAIRNKASQPSASEKVLWLWVLCWMLVFTLPSQRSGRYIIPAMPALAILIAMYADRIHRFWWMLTLALVTLATAALGWIAWCLDGVFTANAGYSSLYFASLGLLVTFCLAGLVQAKWQGSLMQACTACGAVAWLALLGALATPFDNAQGAFDVASRARVVGQAVQVPSNFNASWEKYRFALPKSNPQANPQIEAANFVVRTCPYGAMCKFADGEVLGERFALRTRHTAGEVTLQKLSSREGVQTLLVEREVLMTTSRGTN